MLVLQSVGAPGVQIEIGCAIQSKQKSIDCEQPSRIWSIFTNVKRENVEQQHFIDFVSDVHLALLVFQSPLPGVVHPPDEFDLK